VVDLSTYVNKTVDFKFSGAELRFDLSHALFSSFDIDQGTRLLLKTVARDPVLALSRRILDEGCGVGVIGLCMAKAFPQAELVLRDRDSLAVAFAERNRLANKLRGITAWKDPVTGEEREARPAPRIEWGLLSDGREGGPYDFVLSNLPAKAGAPVLASFFDRLSGRRSVADSSAPALLVPGGRAGIVIVNPLAEAAASWIAQAGLSVVAQARGTGHHVYIVERAEEGVVGAGVGGLDASSSSAEPASGDEGVPLWLRGYLRGDERFKLADFSYRARGFWGLGEFDTPSYGSLVAAEAASRALVDCSRALFLNPGVGHLALWAAKKLGLKSLTVASRDRLSLEAAGANIASLPERSRPEYVAIDALGATDLPSLSFDLIFENPDVVPERDWVGPSWEQAERLVRPGGAYLAVCSPTEMARLEKRRPSGEAPSGGGKPRWALACQRRKKGFVASVWIKG
jgi:hypothetical protein